MIKYTLVCEAAHSFEGWFRNSGDFEAQVDRKLVVCPMCGATDVRKGLMAPAVSTSRKREALSPVAKAEAEAPAEDSETKNEAPAPASATPMQPSALLPENLRQKEIVEALRLVRARIVENSENVGSNFASEARKIHYGDAEERSIYGETTLQDAEELLEEGISVLPLPELPDDKN
ncbi:DUF1178 family protein [Roseibium sp. SCP14]|uniref:DUF1178 family protein n=1 Tax=Roseibium sp. SCP14 TaxID=3141375 RepID=UPI00333D7B95